MSTALIISAFLFIVIIYAIGSFLFLIDYLGRASDELQEKNLAEIFQILEHNLINNKTAFEAFQIGMIVTFWPIVLLYYIIYYIIAFITFPFRKFIYFWYLFFYKANKEIQEKRSKKIKIFSQTQKITGGEISLPVEQDDLEVKFEKLNPEEDKDVKYILDHLEEIRFLADKMRSECQ